MFTLESFIQNELTSKYEFDNLADGLTYLKSLASEVTFDGFLVNLSFPEVGKGLLHVDVLEDGKVILKHILKEVLTK